MHADKQLGLAQALARESRANAQFRDALLPALIDGALRVKDTIARAEEASGRGCKCMQKFLPVDRGVGMGPVAELVLDRVGVIAPLRDEAMASAILQAEKRAHGLTHECYPHLRPLTIRADVREALTVESLPEGWRIDGDPRKMGQLILADETSGMSLRMLKAPYTQQDRVPHAGAGRSRRDVWAQQPLPDVSAQSALADAGTLTGQVFLLLWAYVEPADRTAGYILRVVHTLVPGAFGKSALCDLDLIIPRGGRIDVGDLAFSGSDGEEDLFLFDLPSDAEEDMA